MTAHSETNDTSPTASSREQQRQPWEWRLALNHGFWDVGGKPTFHAHDVHELAACARGFGLVASTEPVNEGSHLCPDCMTVVRSRPLGRPEREVSR